MGGKVSLFVSHAVSLKASLWLTGLLVMILQRLSPIFLNVFRLSACCKEKVDQVCISSEMRVEKLCETMTIKYVL